MTSSEIYLEFLRAGLWNRPAVVSGSINLNEVLNLADSQSTLPLVSKSVLDRCGQKLSPVLAEKLKARVEKCARAHHAANTVIAYVCEELDRAGIESVLLKGQGIASWYSVPTLRQPGDIDLYVRDYGRACEIISRLFPENSVETEKHTAFHIGGSLELELHKFTEVLPSRRMNSVYQKISDEGTGVDLAPVVLEGASIKTPSDTFNALYIFHHLWHHTLGMGIGMRQLCDWTAFLMSHKGKLDTVKLEKWLRDLHLMDIWQVFGCAAVQALELDPEAVPFYDAGKMARGSRLVGFFLKQGDNRALKHGRHGESAVKHKTGSLRYMFKKLGMMFPVFPVVALQQFVRDFKNGLGKLFKARPSDAGSEE